MSGTTKKSPFELKNVAINLAAGGSAGKNLKYLINIFYTLNNIYLSVTVSL